jgi:hypothetical protein
VSDQSERQTRRELIDPALNRAGWEVKAFDQQKPLSAYDHCAITEYPTDNGPADYALCVDGKTISHFPVSLPPLEEQEEIVRRVEALFKLADAVEKRVPAARLRADKLTRSILAKAFRGDLVPTEAELARREGRSYEPASVLLERIRAEREKGKPQEKKRRTRR